MVLGAVKYERLIKLDEDTSVSKLLRWITPKSRVLELGPATGAMTRLLKKELDCYVTAIEIDPEAAELVRPYCDRLIVGNLEKILADNTLVNEHFDFITFADVLEHLTDPWAAIENAKRFLSPTGYLLLSIPNVSHSALIGELLQGKFNYQQDGLLDNTHLRFFTRESVNKLIEGAGLSSVAWEQTTRLPQYTEFAHSFPKLPKMLQDILLQLPDALTYQFLVKIAPKERTEIREPFSAPVSSQLKSKSIAQLYYSKSSVFTESDSESLVVDLCSPNSTFCFSIPAGTRTLRFDPVDQQSVFALSRIKLIDLNQLNIWQWCPEESALASSSSLGNLHELHTSKASVFFPTSEDPQIILVLEKPLEKAAMLEVQISLRPFDYLSEISDLNSKIKTEHDDKLREYERVNEQFRNLKAQIEQKELSYSALRREHANLQVEFDSTEKIRERAAHLEAVLNQIWTSKSWKITKPIRLAVLLLKAVRGIQRQTKNKLRFKLYNCLLLSKKSRCLLDKLGFLSFYDKYEFWKQKQETLCPVPRVCEIINQPKISVILPVYKTPIAWLREAIESVRSQSYPHWELCIADDQSNDPGIRSLLDTYQNEDSRIRVVYREKNGHIAKCSQSALELAGGEFIALLDHDDRLHPHALLRVAEYISAHPETDFMYSNEDKIDQSGKYAEPAFKPAWSPEYFLSFMYTGHLAVYRRSIVQSVGGFIAGTEGSQDYDLTLRVTAKTSNIGHIPHILYHWRAHPDSVALNLSSKEYAFSAAQQSLEKRIAERCGNQVKVIQTKWKGIYSFRTEQTQPFEICSSDSGLENPTEWMKRAITALELSKANILVLKQSFVSISEEDLQYILSPLSLPGVLGTSPLICSNLGNVISAGYGIYQNVLMPLCNQANKNEAGFGARLAAMHNVSFISLACLAVKRELFLKILRSLSVSGKSFGDLIYAIGVSTSTGNQRLAVIPVRATIPKSYEATLSKRYKIEGAEFIDPLLPRYVRPDGANFRVLE